MMTIKHILERILKELGSWWKRILNLFPQKKNPSKMNPSKKNLTLQHKDPFDFIVNFSMCI